MPLSKVQAEIARLLADRRTPGSHVAGGAVLSVTGSRTSRDIDIFHDEEMDVLETATADAALLAQRGFDLEWKRRAPSMCTAVVSKGGERTRLDWAHDSAFRFYPPERNATLGYALHPIDIATNKALAAADRREARDLVDLVEIHRTGLPLSIVVWAAVAKNPGYSPQSLIQEMRRNARYVQEDFDALESTATLDAGALLREFRVAIDEAESFATRMPVALAGRLFLKDGQIVEPDPSRLADYETRAASKGGILPTPT